MTGLDRGTRVALFAALVALAAGYVVGSYAGAEDARHQFGLREDGSYGAGCLAGWACDDE